MGRDTGNLKSKHVEKLIQAGKPGKHYDGQGLRLEIKGPNNASWVSRYEVDGVTRYMGLGSAKIFNLAEARERNRKLVRQKLADGLDPVAICRADRSARKAAAAKAMTFVEASRRFLEQHNAKWANLKHRSQWENTLKTYADPIIGRLPVADIDVPLVLKVLEQPVEQRAVTWLVHCGARGPRPATGCAAGSKRSWTGLRRASIEPAIILRPGTSLGRCCPLTAGPSTTLPCPTGTSQPSWQSCGSAEGPLPRR